MGYCIAAASVEASRCKATLRASDLDSGSLLAQELAIVDAFVTKSVVALRRDYQAHTAPVHAASAAHAAVEAGKNAGAGSQEYQAHAAPVHVASAADAAVEAGAHAGACSWLLRLLAICAGENSMHATAPAPAALAADATGEDGPHAGACSWPLRQE